MNEFGVFSTNSFALAIAPPIPSLPGVNTISAPNTARSFLLSMDMVSGMVKINLYPFAAATKDSPIPVLPLVGSIITESSLSNPSFSAVSIKFTAIRSLMLLTGLKDSTFTSTSASNPSVNLFNLTRGVFPIASVISLAMPLFNSGMFTIIITS